MRFLNQNNNSMDNIQKHFSAAALCAAFLFFTAFASFGQNVIYSCDFEDATENANWILANGDQTNQWYIGTAANNGGSNGLYITNDGGASNAYDNTSTSYVYAYREINFTENAWYNFELDWRGYGQYYYDIMNMFLIPTSVNPDLSAGNANGMEYSPYSTPSEWIVILGAQSEYQEWQHAFIEQEIEAGTYYLVLFWKNNNSYGDNPPAAIDNISITKNNCVSLSDVWVEDIVAESATIVWEERGTATSWDIVISLDYLEDADLESADFITVTDMPYSLTGLEPLTYYYIYVRAACSNNEHSLWKSTSFETPRIPATLPYSFGFEDDTENANWELSDEADNLWAIGTAVSNGGEKGLYISENRGISNTYNNSKQSYAYAFRTINITEPDEYQFDFDWRANGGDSGYDLLRAFVIPTSLDPSISYGYHNDMYSNYNDAPSGWIDASADGLMSGQPRWQHSSKVLDLDAGTYYFVFFWKNSDGADGTNPPAAIDNISILRVINPAVTTSSVTGLNSTSATLHGNILSQGTSYITARGFEYGTDSENLSENTQSTDDTDEFSSTITGLAPNTTYYYRAYATNSEGTGYGTIKSFTTNGSYSGFDFVDLGLPSKTYWATMNIGATSTEDMGDDFAWGETTPKDTYEWSTYQYCNGSDESMTKYCNNPDFGDNGFTDNLTTLEASDDAATANWGSGWRMPIADEAEELYTYCSHVWTTQNGVTGRLFTGPNGRSIFLPGIYNGMSNHYWTNSLYSSYPSEATTLLFGSGTRAELGDYYRYNGLPVRAVYRMAPYLATVSQSNVTLSSATLSGLSYDNGNSDVIERGFQYGTNPDNLTETIQSELGANEFTATLTGLAPNTTYYYRAYATNSDDTGYGEIKSFRTPSGQLGDHYYVNLGLPSGTMWATCNVGGTNFEDLGNEYAWGETATKDEYTQNNYTYSDNPATLPADADAAAVNWGEEWIMPTQEDIQELIDYCNTTWITINGIRGMQATSSNGNSIFIPTNIYEGYSTSGNYWSSSLYTDNPTSAMYMSLYSGDSESDSDVSIWDSERSNPARVRPVYKVAPTAFELGDEPYNCDFENADENAQWVLANGRQPSKWYIGNAASNGGANGLYISADDGAHNSYNFAEPSSTYAYRLINITTADLYQFDFDWRAAGNEDYDYLRAFLIPASIDPDLTPGAGYDPDWINICSTEIMTEQPEWQHSRTAVNIEETGMYYLAFFWENDDYYYGNNPSAAIDNISICKATNFFIDNRDGNIYSFVTIGDQTWLAENLRYAGNIQLGTEISETVPYLYYPDGNEYNVSTYGYLYNWPAAMNGEESSYETPSGVQGICPEGWHLPSEQEWVQLDDYLGRNNTGSMLAGYADSWFYGSLKQSEYFGATGFNALPAGVYSGTSIEFGHITRFWTTTTSVNNSDLIYHKDIISTYTTLYSDLNSKDFGNSVRCVRNTGSIAATLPYDCDFEDDTENANWVLDNGNQTNKWYIGTTANNGGENGLYISNDGGISNTYSGRETRVYAYRDILVPDGTTDLLLSFDWKAKGGSRNYEFLRVYWLDPEVATVTAGDNPPTINGVDYDLAGQPGSYGSFANSHWLSQQNTWQHEVMIISADQFTDMGNGDKIYRLYFHWRNINYSSQPPAAVDNVHLEQIINPIVATSSVSDISTTSATLHGSILSHGTSDITVRGFEYGTDEGNLTEIVQSTDETNDFSVSLTNLASNTTYYYRAYATNNDDTGYGEIKMFTTNGIINDHEFVDLGLPSGTKWATCNVGASNPEDYGDYFAWGETTPKDTYTWETYIYAEGTSNDDPKLTKYNNNALYGNDGFTDNLTTLESTDDAATANWGAGWRMPTETEMRELINNCDITWTTTDVAGMIFTSRSNGKSIFLPAAGTHGADGIRDLGSYGTYWSSSLYTNAPHDSWRFIFYSQNHLMDNDYRYEGLSVRAVYRPTPTVATNSADNITHTTATLHGSISNIGASEIIERGFEYGTDRENLTETVQSTDGTNDFSVSLTNLASGTIYYYRAYATNSDDTGYGEILTFNTKICPDENMCEISYELSDGYGDGWTGCAINVVDVETEIVIATLTIDNGSSATGTLEVCDGREIIFEWVEGEYPEETSYQIFDVNGDEIFYGTGTMYSSVSYTMSCSSCRVVADFTIADITTESATISFTGQGTATSWELIVSETELDDADLENYNNAIILTEPSYSATGLPIATQYYVYVRSVCPNDDKSSWKKGAFNTKICPDEDMCGISYELASEISIGWSGGAINIIDVESEIAIATLTIDQGYSATGIVDVCDGKEIRIDYTAGQYPDFVSYHIFDANGDVIDSYYGLDSPTSHSQLYTVSCPTCRPVKNLRATDVTTESATIRWADYGSAESWEIIVSDEEIDDNALDSNGAIVQSADSTYVATGLTSSTYYYVYVHALCLGSDESQWRSYSFTTTQIPATIPYTCDFEDADENANWILANGDQTNQWHIGSTANNGGENGLYISDDDGVSNEYDNHSTSDVYAYRTIDIDENAFYEISFDWRSNGRGTSYYSDFLDVFLAPVSSGFDLSGGNQPNYLTYDWIYLTENLLAGATSWQNFTKIINIDEGRYNLVFYWRNSSIDIDSGHPAANPPAAIDNISIKVNEVATIPYTCDFEDATENDNWILANENQTNQWYIGSAANNGGENGLYISDDDGTSNEYDINSPSVVYAYRTIDIDEDDIYEISFDWRSNGDGDTPSALLGVFLAPVSSDFNLVGGNDLDNLDDWIIITEEPLADATSWQNFTKIINIDEGSYNLIFYWANRNDGGENPPAAIDNISINSLTLDISVDYPMDRSTTSADIKIHYTNLTYTENSLLFHYGTNRNNINHRVEANYESTNEFFYARITNLEPDTKYYYYAEERSEFGTLLSDTLWFYTYGSFIDDRDNHQYHSIRIGNQIWMAEDLDYAGDIPQGTTETSLTEPYRYRASYCTEYWTYQYNWPAAMNLAGSSNENPSGVQGVCPNGWHLPSADEWQELYDTLGGNERDAGAQLVSGLYSDGKTIAESRYFSASGFDAIYSSGYDTNYENAVFWSATASNTDEAYYHRIYSGSTDLLSGSSEKGYGFNVRCVKGSTYYVYDTLPYCGESYTFGTQTITESGDYTRIVNLGEDTDSIYKLHITFFEIPVATISDFSNGCFGQNNGHATVSVEGGTAPYNYAWNIPEAQNSATLGNLAGGEYTVVVTDANGCSVTSSVEITTPDEIAVSIADTACNSYEWNGTTYTETGEYTQTLHTAEGCDSVVTLQLTINHSSTGEFADLMCAGVPYTYGGETFTEAGTYTVTLTNSVGCDSVVTLTLAYADNCNGIISGVITDDYTGDLIPNARVTIGNNVTYTDAEGQYSLEVLRGQKTMRVSAVRYISYSEIIDVQGDTSINIALNSPRIITSDNISLTTYPYLEQTDTITITNTGNGTLVWSSITEYDGLALVEDSTIQRRNSRSLWDSIQTFATRENAEQAVVTDGFFIYTSSWMRPGEFNRYTPNGEYVETFFIENVGMIRNLSYNGNYFYGTDATNVIYKLDLDNQTLLGSIETDIPEIRHCSFNRPDGSILAGDWNSLYRIDTTSGTSQQIRSDLANVYSSAFDNLSAGGPYLWLFLQTSQDNGPSACIRQFDISANDFTDKIHYLDDIEISDASLAGGICASEYVCEGKFVLLANVQNPSGSNTIATYEIGRTNSVARAERKSGSIAPSESESIPVRASATETGEYASTIRYRAAVMGRQSNDVIVTISSIAPECDAVQQITATTDNSTITLEWSPVELGEYESVSYLVYNTSSQYAIDTLSDTSVTYRGLPLGEHCFYVRALSSAGYTCLSEASDTVCAEIKDSPCDIPLFVEARSDGETITVSWNTHADVDHFNIYKDGESIAENLTTTTFVDTNVVPETDYCYTVVAHLESGSCDEISGMDCMRILTGVCTEAPVLTADAIGNSVILKWTECEGAVKYRIFRDNEFVGTTNEISYTDNVTESGNHCYVIESDCEYGMFKLSNEECVFTDAIDEWSADELSIYPNPTDDQFFIEGQRIATVQIFNAIGQLVTEIENNESERITINCNGWSPGLYSVQIISTEGKVTTQKISIFR